MARTSVTGEHRRMKDDYVSESFAAALSHGRLGPWLKRQLFWLIVFAIGVGAFYAWGKVTGRI